MRMLIAAAAVAAATILPATAASAQYHGRGYGHYDRDVRQEVRECRRELRRADSRREYRREMRECRREISRARWDDRRDRRHYGRYDRYNRYDRYPRRGYGW
ncbi:hypothetical protein [Sphingosinicella terrae]|uniref:hypothetical protein n=1 Tax=Sphingosinicella terrae TaxID=2172047 RepID=UPI000E0DE955|nr:hypothetical protein [Sphingosinicella terrae]